MALQQKDSSSLIDHLHHRLIVELDVNLVHINLGRHLKNTHAGQDL